LTTEYLRYQDLNARALEYAQPVRIDDSAHQNYLVFSVGANRFALPMQALDEIATLSGGIGFETATSVIMGLTNIRGEMILLLDLKNLLGLGTTVQKGDAQKILVLTDNDSHKWAFLVEKLEGVYSLNSAEFQYGNDTTEGTFGIMVKAVGEHDNKAVGLVDVGLVLEAAKRSV